LIHTHTRHHDDSTGDTDMPAKVIDINNGKRSPEGRTRHNSIATRAMLATLHISRWSAVRLDKQVTEEVAIQHGVDARRAGKYRKNVIDPDHPLYVAIGHAASALRQRHNYWTLPWGENATRILPAANFEKYSADMRLLRVEFNRHVAELVKAYPSIVAETRRDLKSMWKHTDYPSDIASSYGVDISIMPLPEAEDFRVDLPDDAINDIRSNITKEVERSLGKSMLEPFERLFDRIHNIVERLSDPEATFRDSLIENLRKVLELLPSLNITNDAQLNTFCERATDLIKGIDASVVRDMPEKRLEIAKQAAQIESDMAAFFGAQPK
jgi:hypothetical protein